MSPTSTRLTVEEVADQWRCSDRHVADEIRRGNLTAIKVAGRWLVEQTDADAYLAARRSGQPTSRRTRRPRGRIA